MTDQIQLSLGTVFKVVLAFILLLALVAFLGYQVFLKPKVAEKDRRIIETNFLIKEKLIFLSNQRRELNASERRSDEIINLSGSITNAPDLEGAISRFLTLRSNQ